ncbi:MAG TPA: hypothetical protein VFF00_06915 [Candidatus Elarobacter sp.]|nr:hypothetical protein [Dongiaceae bacterium]HZW53746.1 hypothetical protein [Candidatus Elarobacter sp.]
MIRLVALLSVLIVVLDAVESIVSLSVRIPYAWFALVQIVVYAAIGFVLRRADLRVRDVAVAALITGLVEATLGEWVALTLGAAPPTPLGVMAVVVPFVIAFDVALALGGFALGSIGRTARS